MKKVFVNPATGLLRAGWRLMAFFAIFLGLTAGGMLAVRFVLGGLRKGSDLQFAILATTATIAVFIARKYLDKQSMTSLGLKWDRHAILDLISGILNSAFVMACVYFLMLWTNLIEFNGFAWWTDQPPTDAVFRGSTILIVLSVFFNLAIVALWEELVFRGYVLQNMIAGIGLMWSIILTSFIFAFGHSFNPDASILSILILAIITPQLIYAYLKTGQLWLPIGLHLGWNFFQASIFGFAASGQVSPSLISQTPVGADWLSGGKFGAEGSILILPFTLFSFFLIHYWVKKSRWPQQRLFETAP